MNLKARDSIKILAQLMIWLSVTSCSSVTRSDKKQYFKEKVFKYDSEQMKYNVRWYDVQKSEINCFKTVDNREVVTVPSDRMDSAIEHFYKRSISVSTKILQTSGGYKYIESTAKDDANYKLEMAVCYVEFGGGLFITNLVSYTSFRLADK